MSLKNLKKTSIIIIFIFIFVLYIFFSSHKAIKLAGWGSVSHWATLYSLESKGPSFFLLIFIILMFANSHTNSIFVCSNNNYVIRHLLHVICHMSYSVTCYLSPVNWPPHHAAWAVLEMPEGFWCGCRMLLIDRVKMKVILKKFFKAVFIWAI